MVQTGQAWYSELCLYDSYSVLLCLYRKIIKILDTTVHQSRPADTDRPSFRMRLEQIILVLVTLVPLSVLVLSAIHVIAPQRQGLLALSQIFAPYLFLGLLAVLPFALVKQARVLRLVLAVCAVVCCIRFLPNVVSASPLETPDATRVQAISWNVYVDNAQTETIRSTLKDSRAGIVALQEFTWAQHEALVGDAELTKLYPYRIVVPGGADGMGILSAYPMLEQGQIVSPQHPHSFPVLWARLDIGDNRTITVVNAHPRPGHVTFAGNSLLLNGFDPTIRDEEVAFVRSFIEPMLARGEHVLILGDFNLTEREPAYHELRAGMHDAHADVGFGTGHSWRPAPLMNRNIAAIRIDYMLSSQHVRPTRIATDCTPRGGDHCLLQGTFEVN